MQTPKSHALGDPMTTQYYCIRHRTAEWKPEMDPFPVEPSILSGATLQLHHGVIGDMTDIDTGSKTTVVFQSRGRGARNVTISKLFTLRPNTTPDSCLSGHWYHVG